MTRRDWIVYGLACVAVVFVYVRDGDSWSVVAAVCLWLATFAVVLGSHRFEIRHATRSRSSTQPGAVDEQLAADMDRVFADLDKVFADFDRAMDRAVWRKRAGGPTEGPKS